MTAAEPDPRPRWRRPGWWGKLALQLPLYALCGWIIALYSIGVGNRDISLPVGIFEFCVGAYICIWIHELGHAGAALAVGWRVIVFAVHPFAIHLANREIVPMRRTVDAELGGYVFAVPSRPGVTSIGRKAWVVAGGPLANIGFGLILVGYAWSLGPSSLRAATVFALGLQSFWVATNALLPSALGQHQTDGSTLGWLYRNRADYDRVMPMAWLEALASYQVRLRDHSQWLMDLAEARLERNEEAHRWLDARNIGRMLDSATVDVAGTRAALDSYRIRYGTNEWHASCDAYLAAVWEQDDAAESQLWHGEGMPFLVPLRRAAEAAVAARCGDPEGMRAGLDAMDAALRARSGFTDLTFRDIRSRIAAIPQGDLAPA